MEHNYGRVWIKLSILINKNFRLRFEWDWKEFGVGFVLFKPIHKPFPRKNSWIGITIRLLWFGIFIRILERKQDTTALEIYEQKERMKEISAFHYNEMKVSKNDSTIDVFWNWHCFGMMIFYQTPQTSMSCCISLLVLWSTISYDFRKSRIFTRKQSKWSKKFIAMLKSEKSFD